MTAALDIAEELRELGFAVVPEVLREPELRRTLAALDGAADAGGRRRESVYAMRNLLDVPEVRALGASPAVRALVQPLLGPDALLVGGKFFDKTEAANWKVPWHQDLSIAVRERRDAPGFGPWSVKAGAPHAHAPAEVLEGMLAVRLHLDPCGEENGPLQVLPGAHAHGRLGPDAVREWRLRVAPVACVVPAGGALLLRPLLLHASSAAAWPGHRRVIHLEFAAGPLPGGLEWLESDLPTSNQ